MAPVGPEQFDGSYDIDDVIDFTIDEALTAYEGREEELGEDVLKRVERSVMLSVIDNKWRDHLAVMDYLRAGIGLRAICGSRTMSVTVSFAKSARVCVSRNPSDRRVENGREMGSVI